MTAVTPTDRPKSVRNSYVIKVFGGVFMLSRCFLDCSVGVGVFVTGLSQISSFFSLHSRQCDRDKKRTLSNRFEFISWHNRFLWKGVKSVHLGILLVSLSFDDVVAIWLYNANVANIPLSIIGLWFSYRVSVSPAGLATPDMNTRDTRKSYLCCFIYYSV